MTRTIITTAAAFLILSGCTQPAEEAAGEATANAVEAIDAAADNATEAIEATADNAAAAVEDAAKAHKDGADSPAGDSMEPAGQQPPSPPDPPVDTPN